MNRRDFIKASAVFTASIIIPSRTLAKGYEKRLHLYNIHTMEKLNVTYWAGGQYIYEEIANIEYLLRDYHNDEVHKIDINLIEYLHDVYTLLDRPGQIYVISGYRSPYTNYILRKRNRGVAKKSFHMKGKAIDIRIPSVHLSSLRYAALSLRRGGVGYYPRSNFVHIDTGTPRYWRFPKR